MVTMDVPILKDHFNEWAAEMKSFLGSHDLDDVIGWPVSMNLTWQQKKQDRKVLLYIQAAIGIEMLGRIIIANRASEAWKILEIEFSRHLPVQVVSLEALRCRYNLMRMSPNDSIQDYVDELQNLVDEMRRYGNVISGEKLVKKLLDTVDGKFQQATIPVRGEKKQSRSVVELSKMKHPLPRFNDLVEALKAYEMDLDETPVAVTLYLRFVPRSPNDEQTAGFLGKAGEVKGPRKKKHTGEKDIDVEDIRINRGKAVRSGWVTGSACTNHVTFDETLFKCIEYEHLGKMVMPGGYSVPVIGRGTVEIVLGNEIICLSDVFYTPHLAYNVLSLGQLMVKGFEFVCDHKRMVMKDRGGSVILVAEVQHNLLYELVPSTKSTGAVPPNEVKTIFL